MSEITLREVCEKLGVSRRAVQGYEKAGLVTASGKTAGKGAGKKESSDRRFTG